MLLSRAIIHQFLVPPKPASISLGSAVKAEFGPTWRVKVWLLHVHSLLMIVVPDEFAAILGVTVDRQHIIHRSPEGRAAFGGSPADRDRAIREPDALELRFVGRVLLVGVMRCVGDVAPVHRESLHRCSLSGFRPSDLAFVAPHKLIIACGRHLVATVKNHGTIGS